MRLDSLNLPTNCNPQNCQLMLQSESLNNEFLHQSPVTPVRVVTIKYVQVISMKPQSGFHQKRQIHSVQVEMIKGIKRLIAQSIPKENAQLFTVFHYFGDQNHQSCKASLVGMKIIKQTSDNGLKTPMVKYVSFLCHCVILASFEIILQKSQNLL